MRVSSRAGFLTFWDLSTMKNTIEEIFESGHEHPDGKKRPMCKIKQEKTVPFYELLQ